MPPAPRGASSRGARATTRRRQRFDGQAEALQASVRAGVLVRGSRHLRAGPRRREAALPGADVQRRPVPVHRHRQRRARGQRRRDGLMDQDVLPGWGVRTVPRRRGPLQPDVLPQRLGLAARQRADRRRAGALRPERPRAAAVLGLFDAADSSICGGCRSCSAASPAARRGADPLSGRLLAAGLGGAAPFPFCRPAWASRSGMARAIPFASHACPISWSRSRSGGCASAPAPSTSCSVAPVPTYRSTCSTARARAGSPLRFEGAYARRLRSLRGDVLRSVGRAVLPGRRPPGAKCQAVVGRRRWRAPSRRRPGTSRVASSR